MYFILHNKIYRTYNLLFPTLEASIKQSSFAGRRSTRSTSSTCAVKSNKRCNPQTWDEYEGYLDGCCTAEQRCGEMEGDCSDDSDCMPGLVCGKNNCPKDTKSPKGQGFGERADCCEPLSDEFKPGNDLAVFFM